MAATAMADYRPGLSYGPLHPNINIQDMNQASLQMSSRMSIHDDDDDLYSDGDNLTPHPVHRRDAVSNMDSFLVYEPVVESVAKETFTDWRRYEPPTELLHIPDNTSPEIIAILEPSIQSIKTRYAEEEAARIAQARPPRPLTRGRKSSVKPSQKPPLMTGALHPLDIPVEASSSSTRSSAGSVSSSGTFDSGYASRSPSPSPSSGISRSHSPSSAAKGKGRASIIPSFFRRARRPSSAGLENGTRASNEIISGEISIPVPSAPINTTSTVTVECVSCLDDFAPSEVIPLTCHSYCKDCFTRLITTALESETAWPAKCCLNSIPKPYILPNISRALQTKYHLRSAEWSIPAADRIYCSKAACNIWIPPAQISLSTHLAKCSACSSQTCTTCHGPSHGAVDCPSDPALLATIALGNSEGWKRCYQCKALVEHNQGCRHMTCRCKAEFCYICTKRWRTCACTDAQLDEIQTRVRTQRNLAVAETARQGRERAITEAREARERIRREEAEEEERINVQLVAEFMAAETERERVALEALMAQEEAERVEREAARRLAEERRIQGVSARFRMLGSEMEALHNIQRMILAERHEFEGNRLVQNLQDDLAVLAARYPSEVAELKAESKAVVLSALEALAVEKDTRRAKQQEIEETYLSEVRLYWDAQGVLDTDIRVVEARDELRRNQDGEYQIWNTYRRKQMQELRETEERKMVDLEKKFQAEMREVEGRAKIDEVVRIKLVDAESRWMQEVMRERAEMLGNEERRLYAEDQS